jgi:hypothetical protein
MLAVESGPFQNGQPAQHFTVVGSNSFPLLVQSKTFAALCPELPHGQTFIQNFTLFCPGQEQAASSGLLSLLLDVRSNSPQPVTILKYMDGHRVAPLLYPARR